MIEKLTGLIFYCRLIAKTKGDSTPPYPQAIKPHSPRLLGLPGSGELGCPGTLRLGVELSKCYALRGKEVEVLCERREAQFPKEFHTRDAEQQRGTGWWDKRYIMWYPGLID